MNHAVARLTDQSEIVQVLHQVARATDRSDRQLFEGGYHPDALDFHGVANGPVSGIAAALDSMNDWCVASHHAVTNIEIEFDGDQANVRSYFTAFHRRSDESGEWDEWVLGRYIDRFERRGGAWKIAKRIAIWDWSSIDRGNETPFTGKYPGNYVFGRRDRQDASYTGKHPPA